MEFFNNHRKLFTAAFLMFLGLTILIAILPAWSNQSNNAALPGSAPLTGAELKGKALYISNGCVACHTQQVRNIDMDKVWGDRPSIAADYANNHRIDLLRNTATLMGTERTGPDLTNVGKRQPSREWHLVHLYNPRAVVPESIMPGYPWLFELKEKPGKNDVVVNVPAEFLKGRSGKLVATADALHLVAYLQSLKQTPLPDGSAAPEFLYKRKDKPAAGQEQGEVPDGLSLYAANCQSCHQENGEGLKGAFPPLKGSSIVLNDDPELMVDVIMNGYSGRISEGFGPMPPVGLNNNLSAEEVTAIMNHERTSWGNRARKVTVEEVSKIMEFVKLKSVQ